MANLPPIKHKTKLKHNFPTDWQAVLFRNYGQLPLQNIAKVIDISLQSLEREADNLGLSKIGKSDKWQEKGYISLIKNNWHLLPYEQIIDLLDMSLEQLAFILKEDDFLDAKLGDFKPHCEKVCYRELNADEVLQTKEIKKIVEKYQSYAIEPFSFKTNAATQPTERLAQSKFDRIIYSYLAVFGDVFITDTAESYPDWLLEEYQKKNINGLWMQGILYQLSRYDFDEKLSQGYEIRRKNLNSLIERCKKYGIKIYLYFNEPRAMPSSFFEGREHLKGHNFNNLYSLCTSNKEVKDYLYTATKELLNECSGLGGLITITMSENLTHCYSRSFDAVTTCPRCSAKKPYELAAEVNNIFAKAARDSKSRAKIISNLWCWDSFTSWSYEDTKKGIDALDKDISVMLISENSMEISKADTKSIVIDYSISNVGPSERSKNLLQYAKSRGHKIFAKVQINNSWECSAVPFIPVFDLIKEHIDNLKKVNIDGLMLSWTLGGYPSLSLDFLDKALDNSFDEKLWYDEKFGDASAVIKNAVTLFSKAFENYPFDLEFLYKGPVNLGSANLWYVEPTGQDSTMVGFPYDDLTGWKGVFSKENLIKLLEKLSSGWKEGLDLLDGLNEDLKSNENVDEIITMAQVCYCHFYSSYLNSRFIMERDTVNSASARQTLIELIDKEKLNVMRLYNAQSKDARIGFEASNHYYYNQNLLLEKIINLNAAKRSLSI